MPDQQNSASGAETVPALTETPRPLIRMRQLAEEVRSALAQNDLELVSQISALLAPTLAQWQENQEAFSLSPGESVGIALETRAILDECEAVLTKAMASVASEMNSLRRGKRAVVAVRTRQPGAMTGHMLDTER